MYSFENGQKDIKLYVKIRLISAALKIIMCSILYMQNIYNGMIQTARRLHIW